MPNNPLHFLLSISQDSPEGVALLEKHGIQP